MKNQNENNQYRQGRKKASYDANIEILNYVIPAIIILGALALIWRYLRLLYE